MTWNLVSGTNGAADGVDNNNNGATDEVGEGKPSPAVYLRAVALLGTDPAGTIAVEGSVR